MWASRLPGPKCGLDHRRRREEQCVGAAARVGRRGYHQRPTAAGGEGGIGGVEQAIEGAATVTSGRSAGRIRIADAVAGDGRAAGGDGGPRSDRLPPAR